MSRPRLRFMQRCWLPTGPVFSSRCQSLKAAALLRLPPEPLSLLAVRQSLLARRRPAFRLPSSIASIDPPRPSSLSLSLKPEMLNRLFLFVPSVLPTAALRLPRRLRSPIPPPSPAIAATMAPKRLFCLEGAKTAPPSPEDDGGDRSGHAQPVRRAPDTAALKRKETPELAAKKSSPLPSDASPPRGDGVDSAAPPPRKKSKTTKQAKRHPPPSQEEDEVEESGVPSLVREVPADDTTTVSPRREVAASAGHKKGGANPARKRARRSATPTQEEEEQAQKKKRNNGSYPQEDNAEEEEQQGEMVEQGHAGNTPLLQMDDGAEEEEQRLEKIAEHDDNTSLPQQKDGAHEG